MSHPECLAAVVSQSELVVSTSQMAKHAREDTTKEFIVGTEAGLIYRLKQDNPTKEFYLASERAVCPNMKRTTQEKVLWALEELKDEVKVSEEIRKKARLAIDRMLSIL
jgi:quinolinate synthase